ncbi:MAG: phosphate signaling complex protein PhoU [Deltaproteobacteria bacterium]|nr:phosphate signaling complex protein PhoU [Deltaproteobacteria bacterium]
MLRAHTVKSYDEQMEKLNSRILEMGARARTQLARSLEALSRRDHTIAQEIVRDEPGIDALREEVDQLTVGILAMRQPMAIDLRIIVTSLKTASELERIADRAAGIAGHVMQLNCIPLREPVELILQMAAHTLRMLDKVLEAYRTMDVDDAVEVWHMDEETDRIYQALLQQLQHVMQEESGTINDGMRLLVAAKSYERIGDHVQNIAEHLYYIVTGDTYCGR